MKIKLSDIPVVLLAAGDSKRMGIPKGLLEYKGEPFILAQIANLEKMGFQKISIVLGKSKEQYFDKVPDIKDYKIEINPDPDKGVFSSIQCGLSNLSGHEIGIFILPIDVPCPKKYVWKQMVNAMNSSDVSVVVPSFEGKKGHPVLLSSEFKDYILTLNSESRLDFEIRKQENQRKVKIISIKDSTILLNLNTIEEWDSFKVI